MSILPEEGILFETKTFNWKMKLSKLLDMPEDKDLFSPYPFILGEHEWYMSLIHTQNWIGCYLFLKSEGVKIPATYRIKVEIVRSGSRNLKSQFTSEEEFESSKGYGSNEIFTFSFDPTIGEQNDDILFVKCKIWTRKELEAGGSIIILPKCHYSFIGPDIEELLDDSILTDLTIQVDGEELKAHKSILAARSPVFRRMFVSEMVEAANSQLIIEDFSAKVVQQMLEFMYSGDKSLIGKYGVPLKEMLQIADKYEFNELKGVCEELLVNTLTVDNVIEMLIFADMQNAPNLKKKTLECIAKKSLEVFKTNAYLELKSVEIFKEICSTMAIENSKV